MDDILEAINKIERYVAGLTYEQFLEDDKTKDATARNLEIIGEATKNIPDEIKANYPAIEWKRIAGMRDILAHDYFGLRWERVWDVVENKLPELRSTVATMLEQEKPADEQ